MFQVTWIFPCPVSMWILNEFASKSIIFIWGGRLGGPFGKNETLHLLSIYVHAKIDHFIPFLAPKYQNSSSLAYLIWTIDMLLILCKFCPYWSPRTYSYHCLQPEHFESSNAAFCFPISLILCTIAYPSFFQFFEIVLNQLIFHTRNLKIHPHDFSSIYHGQ